MWLETQFCTGKVQLQKLQCELLCREVCEANHCADESVSVREENHFGTFPHDRFGVGSQA